MPGNLSLPNAHHGLRCPRRKSNVLSVAYEPLWCSETLARRGFLRESGAMATVTRKLQIVPPEAIADECDGRESSQEGRKAGVVVPAPFPLSPFLPS